MISHSAFKDLWIKKKPLFLETDKDLRLEMNQGHTIYTQTRKSS
uniref:Uncharacterized protein n=1 Tax=Octopus bimaculoides TaxID=37653 RepID=A0A0L8HJJ2_OCTBM